MWDSVESFGFDAQRVRLDRLRAGSHEEFERTVRRLWRDAMIVVLGAGIPKHDADAVVNNVFVALYETIRRGKGPVNEAIPDWRRYVRRCAHHAAVDYWRQTRRVGRVASLEDLFDESPWEDRIAGGAHEPAATSRIERLEEDAAHRLTDTANYGTYNADGWKDNSSAPSYGASAPSRSDTVLV
ncbi:MAG: hypothetical protein IT449_07590, partial [Phycisphaerales bacterium]|nr:hypothetical protein [Phycisphaerales bacterium]